MTTNEVERDPESVADRQITPAHEQVEISDEEAKHVEDVELPESVEEKHSQPQQVEDRSGAEPEKEELSNHLADSVIPETVGRDETDLGALPLEAEITNIQEKEGANHGDGANSETRHTSELANLEAFPDRAAGFLSSPQRRDTLYAPDNSKEAVQDPGVLDITPSATDNGVIDVDTFDDDVSEEDEPDPSPVGDETITELDDANERSDDKTNAIAVHATRSEPIDLTVSLSTQPTEGPKLQESGENMCIVDKIATEKEEEITREGIIDVDEAEETDALEPTKPMLVGEDVNSSQVEEDEKHGKGAPDAETVSAELNVDLNGEDVSPEQTHLGSTVLETAAEGEIERQPLLHRARVVERGDEEEQTMAESRIVSEDGGLDTQIDVSTSKTDDGIAVLDTSVRKPEAEGEPPVTQVESEDEEMEDDSGSGRDQHDHEENQAEEDDSPPLPGEITDFENDVHQKTASADQNEVLMENVRDGDFRPQQVCNQSFAVLQDKEATSRTERTHERTVRPCDDVIPPVDNMNESDTISIPFDGGSQPVESKDKGDSDAFTIKATTSEEKAVAKTVVRDVGISHAAHVGVTPDPMSQEKDVSKEMQSFGPVIKDPQVSRQDGMEDLRVDDVTGPAKVENKFKTSFGSTAPYTREASFGPSKDQAQDRSEPDKETDRSTAVVPIHDHGNSTASEAVKQPTETTAQKSVEQNKNANTGHLAPMFGIQLSRPMKGGSVSFSSPPSFPRYSLNPQAVPFFPAKARESDSSEKPTDASVTPSVAVSTPSNETKVTDTESPQRAGEKDEKTNATEPHTLERDKKETLPVVPPNTKSSIAAVQSQVSADKASLTDSLTEYARHTSTESADQSSPEFKTASAPESSPKRLTQKKVSFAPTPIKSGKPWPESEREPTAESDPARAEPIKATETDHVKGAHGLQLAPPSAKTEREKLAKPEKKADGVKEKQRIIQVQTNEGLRREVKNVTVAMRQGNSKVRPERKKFTIRLTTGTQENSKLQLFKVSGPSLKLYASLDSSRDNLRVRKVTNRQYVMSVAKMARPGDDNGDIKYFLHFDERDTFEEMHSQCVAHLQKQPRPTVITKKPEEGPKISSTVVEEIKEDRPSSKGAGVKRSAEDVSAAQVSKKSKLLADKKKLLDKMAALRRKKEQKGTSVAKGRQKQPFSKTFPSSASGASASDKDDAHSFSLKPKTFQATPEDRAKDRNSIQENAPNSEKSLQPPKKRTAEDMSNENASKRARFPNAHSTSHEMGVTRAPLSGGQSEIPTSMRDTAVDGMKEKSADTGISPMVTEESPSKVDTGLSQKRLKDFSDRKETSGDVASARQKSKESEAFGKMTRDLKEAENEKKGLQEELESRNRLLHAEREKSLRVQQENSEAWQRVVKTFEALSSDIGRLRREDADRSLESLTRCEASSSEDFFDRLHSFRPSTWAAFENSEIGALECALRGWHNSGPGKIRSSEGSEVTLSENFDDSNLREREVERVRSLLREGHCLLSGWVGQSCPDSFRTLEGSQRMLTREQLKANVERLREEGMERSNIRFEWGTSALLLSDDVCEQLAVYNWCLDGECLRCSWCSRRVAVEGASRFDARSKHYAFCPFRAEDWKMSVLRNATTLGIEGDGDAVMKDETSAS